MPKRRFRISTSPDGFIAGPNQSRLERFGVGGERLFDTVDDLHGLPLVETIAAPNVTHLKFAR